MPDAVVTMHELGAEVGFAQHAPDAGTAIKPQDFHMPKMRKKSELPTKTCAVCGLPFSWRKKWERDWPNVTHCSDRCRNAAKATRPRAKA